MKNKTYYIILFVAGLIAFSACDKVTELYVQPLTVIPGQYISSDTLAGSVKGTLQGGKIYYFDTDLVINAGDTLIMEPGSKLISLGSGGSWETSPQITCNGTFISIGTKDSNNYITVPDNLRNFSNAGKGYWGGIQCGENSGDIVIKWTHLEFAGGAAGPAADVNVFSPGDPRNSLSYTNPNGNIIIEDSWIYGTQDDGMRLLHGHISVMRNTFEDCGTTGGEGLNIKNNSTGDVAYNVIIGASTNAFKISNSGGGPETNIFLYNNTMINCGFRQLKSGRGGSIDYEKGASGKIYNNMIVNCRIGLRITADADFANVAYNNQFYYGQSQSIISLFLASDANSGEQLQSNDIYSSTPESNNPTFISYDVNRFDYTSVSPPLEQSAMPLAIVTAEGNDFNLLSGSPALGKGDVSNQAMKTVPQGGTLGATTLQPSKDMGAYPSSGSGNQHITSSLDSQ